MTFLFHLETSLSPFHSPDLIQFPRTTWQPCQQLQSKCCFNGVQVSSYQESQEWQPVDVMGRRDKIEY